MRLRSRLLFILFLILMTTACQGLPPTQYVIVTSTPDGTPTPTPTLTPIVIIVTTTTEPGATFTATPMPQPTSESTPELTATLQLQGDSQLPTVTIAQIQVAEQIFQNGRMYWLQPIDQIWVMVETQSGQGVWTVYSDEFEEGDMEFDPQIVAPGGLVQPERGFGKLWRDNEEIRQALGWGLQPELGFVSNYRYEPGGEVIDGEFVPGFGYHVLNSSDGNVYRFNEINGTWQLLRSPRR
jgi:hypothetical protein